jgi:hypothetical protein
MFRLYMLMLRDHNASVIFCLCSQLFILMDFIKFSIASYSDTSSS